MRKCINCIWDGDEKLNDRNNCPVCGDETILVGKIIEPEKPVSKKAEPKIDYDLNNDGKVDKEDISLMAKGLRTLSRKKKGAKK